MLRYVDNEENVYVKNENFAKFIKNNLGTYPERYIKYIMEQKTTGLNIQLPSFSIFILI